MIKNIVYRRKRFGAIAILLCFLIVPFSYIHAVWDGDPYEPNETLDPECSPLDADCTVSFGFTLLDGNIGIGTSTPYAPLSVVGETVSEYFTATSTSATSTLPLLDVTQLSIGSLSGILRATDGYVSTSLIDLTSDVSDVLGISHGGTGTTTAPSYGELLVGNNSGGYDLVATSSLGFLDQSDLDVYFPLSTWYATTTDALDEGVSNVYWTENRFASALAGTTTDALSQGITNLYYADSLVNSYIHSSSTIPKTYTSNTFTGSNIFSSITLGSLNGPLQANAGVLSATTSIGVLYGGTGLTTAPSYGNLLVGNSSGGYTLTATSSLGISGSKWDTATGGINYSGGNVGIGTLTPSSMLTLAPVYSATPFMYVSSPTYPAANVGFGFNGGGSNFGLTTFISGQKVSTIESNGGMAIGRGYSGTGGDYPNDSLLVEGDVGIGTTAPLATLNVVSSATKGGLLIGGRGPSFAGNVDSNVGPVLYKSYADSSHSQMTLVDSRHYGSATENGFRYLVGFDIPMIDGVSADGNTRKSITFGYIDTNVGVGFDVATEVQASIASKLSVKGNTSIGSTYSETAAPSNGLIIEGNVGIATTSPWRTFSVAGTVGFSGLTGSTGAGSLCLDSNMQVVYNSGSDSCLPSLESTKYDITPLSSDTFDRIQGLEPVSFIYKNDTSNTVRYGFIAEDAARVDEHFATYNAEGEISGIDDRSILAVIIDALKIIIELIQKIEEAIRNLAISLVTQEVKTEKLCVGSVCVTETEFLELFDKEDLSKNDNDNEEQTEENTDDETEEETDEQEASLENIEEITDDNETEEEVNEQEESLESDVVDTVVPDENELEADAEETEGNQEQIEEGTEDQVNNSGDQDIKETEGIENSEEYTENTNDASSQESGDEQSVENI